MFINPPYLIQTLRSKVHRCCFPVGITSAGLSRGLADPPSPVGDGIVASLTPFTPHPPTAVRDHQLRAELRHGAGGRVVTGLAVQTAG